MKFGFVIKIYLIQNLNWYKLMNKRTKLYLKEIDHPKSGITKRLHWAMWHRVRIFSEENWYWKQQLITIKWERNINGTI